MRIRPRSYYDKFFLKDYWIKRERVCYPCDGINDEEMIGYVFEKMF